VEGDFQTRAAFFAHNQQIQEQAQQLQAKTRRGDLLLGEEARFEFYDKRLPAEVCDGARLDKWLRTAGRDNPQLLFMRVEDLLHDEAEEPAQQAFPDRMTVRSMELPLEYRYDPGAPQDGVTISVPQAALNQLDARRLGWLVPGLLEEKVIALIKSLPKPLRRFFVPVPETAKRVLTEMQFGQGDLVAAVAAVLSRMAGEKITLSDFQPTDLPGHLQINIRVLDPEGNEVAEGRNLGELQQKLGKAASASLAEIDQGAWSRQGLTAWDFDTFPAEIELGSPGFTLKGYPALLDRGETVDLRLLDNPERAQRETLAGLRRLFVLANQRELKAQVDWLPGIDAIKLISAILPAGREFKRSIGDLLADRAFLSDGAIPRTRAEYDARMKLGRARIGVAVQEIAGLLEPLLQAYQQAKLGLERLNAPSWRYAAEDIRRQLTGLVAPGFLTTTPWPWLLQYPRYLRAVSARLAKLAGGRMQQDQRTAELLHRHVARFEQYAQSPAGQNSNDPQLIAYRWMLEEFRVSLFAQELGTSVPVSDKRLDKQWERVGATHQP
jgi:ATP-dependent helicase HrpA